MGMGICCTAVGYRRENVYHLRLNFEKVLLLVAGVAPYLGEPRLEALLLSQRGGSQTRVGGAEEVARVHIEGWNLSCRTWMHHRYRKSATNLSFKLMKSQL